MPQRLYRSTRKFDSAKVQGAGSYVTMRRMTYGEFTELDTKDRPVGEIVNEILPRMIDGWNWVDDDGNPLPLPSDTPGVMDHLMLEERTFLIECYAAMSEASSDPN